MCAEMIPFVGLSEEKKLELERSLRERNLILARYHGFFTSAAGVEDHKRRDFFNMIVESGPGDIELSGVRIPASDVAKICEIKDIEWRLIQGFSKLISKMARKWHDSTNDLSLDVEDLESEAFQAAVYSVLHFTKEERYSTFLYHCVNRHISKICSKSGGLSGISRECSKRRRRCQKLLLEEGATFDSVVGEMGLSDRQIRRLHFSLTKVRAASDLSDEQKELVAVDNHPGPSEKYEVSLLEKIVPNLDLNELEKAVLDGFMNSPSGSLGIGSLSKNLINPKTNKPYTRMSFTYAWKRVKKKIADACGQGLLENAAA
jgi:DNA-directed RNA polymerase specialized sigma subunit